MSCGDWVENFFSKFLARNDLSNQFFDPHSAFMIIVDMGARILFHYTSLEGQWVNRRQLSYNNTT